MLSLESNEGKLSEAPCVVLSLWSGRKEVPPSFGQRQAMAQA